MDNNSFKDREEQADKVHRETQLLIVRAYCKEHKVLPFFAHPDLHLDDEGKMLIDDQNHIKITQMCDQPNEFFERFWLEEYDYSMSLEDHMDAMTNKAGAMTCGEASDIYEALRLDAKALEEELRLKAEEQDAKWAKFLEKNPHYLDEPLFPIEEEEIHQETHE